MTTTEAILEGDDRNFMINFGPQHLAAHDVMRLARACAVPLVLFGAACSPASAEVDMSGGFDVKNLEHVEVVVPKIAAIFEPEVDRIEFCTAATRVALSGLDLRDLGTWSAVNFTNLVWEAELKTAIDGGAVSLKSFYNAKRRVDWPAHLRTFEMHQKLLSKEGADCGRDVMDAGGRVDWSEFE